MLLILAVSCHTVVLIMFQWLHSMFCVFGLLLCKVAPGSDRGRCSWQPRRCHLQHHVFIETFPHPLLMLLLLCISVDHAMYQILRSAMRSGISCGG